jgi:hypothetical protein
MYLLALANQHCIDHDYDPRDMHVVFCDHATRLQIQQEKILVQQASQINTYHEYVYT